MIGPSRPAGMTICVTPGRPSRGGMMEVPDHTTPAATVWMVDNAGLPKGWDLGNACTGKMDKKGVVWEEEPWTGEQIEAFLAKNSQMETPDLGDLEEPTDDDTEWKEDGGAPASATGPPFRWATTAAITFTCHP